MEELEDEAKVPAGQRVQVMAEALEKKPGPQAMHADAFDRENVPLGHGVQALLPLKAQVPALQAEGKTDTAELQNRPAGQGRQEADAEAEYVPGAQAEQKLGENAPTIEEKVPAGQATQVETLKNVPAGHGMQGDTEEFVKASTGLGVFVWGQPETSAPYGAYMKLGVHKGVLAMYSLACEHRNMETTNLGTHAVALYMSGRSLLHPRESTP
jgi:hypothetical protein